MLTLLLVLPLVGCRQKPTYNQRHLKIGIIQYAEHPALDAAREGFVDALKKSGYEEGKNVTFIVKNAQGDQSNLQTMVEQLKGKTDLNFAIATPAAQSLLNTDPDTPSVFTAVTNPVSAGLVKSMEEPGGNMTGTIDANNVNAQMELLLKALPDTKTVGIFYNSSEVNSENQAKEARKALEANGIKVVEKTVTNSNDVQQVITSLAGQVDAIFLPTDNMVASTITTIGQALKEAKVPALGSDEALAEHLLLTSGIDYRAIGGKAGKQALKILKGQEPAKIAVEKPDQSKVKINEDMAKAIGISVEKLKGRIK